MYRLVNDHPINDLMDILLFHHQFELIHPFVANLILQFRNKKQIRKERIKMRNFVLILTIMLVFVLVACNDQSESTVDPADDNSNQDESVDNGADEPEAESDKEPVSLQVLKVDDAAGITIENNETYQVIQETVDAEPYMGDENDISLYPFDMVESEDGASSLLFLVINRLDDPIRNLIFSLTFGNDEGDYIFEDHVIDLPEEYMGILEDNGVVPVLIDVEGDHEDLFNSLTLDNLYLEIDDVGIDFVE